MATFKASFQSDNEMSVSFSAGDISNAVFGQIQKIETGDYEKLNNHPYINNIEIIGSKKAKDYKLQDKMDVLSVQEIEKILYL